MDCLTAFLGHYMSQSYASWGEGLIFLAIFSMTMFDSFYLEPRPSKGAKRVRPQFQILSKRLKKLNVMSSFLNVLTLVGLTSHLFHRSQLVHSRG
uniref:Uncharacterized protein n=1 Tax=Solanum lycopersicum TaxID=4081 RepID=A0A3Q7GYR0_SOLLC